MAEEAPETSDCRAVLFEISSAIVLPVLLP
jgi:hypothetical protein